MTQIINILRLICLRFFFFLVLVVDCCSRFEQRENFCTIQINLTARSELNVSIFTFRFVLSFTILGIIVCKKKLPNLISVIRKSGI